MASAISKRQQARSERQLQDLIHTVPGNDRCADCAVKNPGWASWSLGIFLCVRCASLHRKLGVHVSKVKSLSMDSWSGEQVENMKKMGNVRSNAKFNPRSARPDIPIDADMVDSAMEKFIRQKYELRTLSDGVGVGAAAAAMPAARQNTGSTGTESWSEEPPPLPPKPGKRFGFNLRSASSTFHRQKQDHFTPPLSPTFSGSDRSARDDHPSPHKNKPSQVFGMKITSIGNNFDTKLITLRDMGFTDNGRNTDILKSTNGNVDRAVEILIRLGEGGKSASRAPAPAPRSITPLSMSSSGLNGISIDKTRQPKQKASNNPWEVKEEVPEPVPQPAAPPRSQSAGPVAHSWNPFLQPQQQQSQQQNLESSFQNLQFSQTGPQHHQQQSFQQPPSVPQIPQQYQSDSWQPQPQPQAYSDPWQTQSQQQQPPQSFTMDAAFSQQQQFQQQPQPAAVPSGQSSNPFLRTSRSQTFAPSNPWMSQSQLPAPIMQQLNPWSLQSQSQSSAPVQQASNPFGAPWQQQPAFQQPAASSPAPISGQQGYLSQQQQQIQQPTGSLQPFDAAQNPWQQQQTSMAPPQQQQYQPQPQFSQPYSQQQQPTRHDKSSILALYNMPQLAPARPLHTLQEDPSASNQPQQQQPMAPPQRSVTMPLSQQGSTNPFGPPQTQGARHVSNESVDFVGMGAGGRHSPDAFAGLSARYMR